jgi:hypothetical protein
LNNENTPVTSFTVLNNNRQTFPATNVGLVNVENNIRTPKKSRLVLLLYRKQAGSPVLCGCCFGLTIAAKRAFQ